MTILIAFHQSAYRNFKWFYIKMVCRHWRGAFPGLVSDYRYNCLVNLVCGLIAYCHQPKKPSLMIDTALPASA